MQQSLLDDLARRLVVESGVSPGAALAVGVRVGSIFRFAVGAAGRRSVSHPEPIVADTPFDLASVTKPFVACTAARLVQAGRLDWNDTLGTVLPELADTASGPRTLIELLSHRAGLDAHRPLFLPLLSGLAVALEDALRTAAMARRIDCPGEPPPGGFEPVYSDLGYLLAGSMIARAANAPLGDVIDREVSIPLGLDAASAAAWAARDSGFRNLVAPTEVVPFRGGEIIGEVHDENAWAVSRLEVSGHAGLFGTARGVLEFGRAVLDALRGERGEWLKPQYVGELVRVRPGGTLRAGFDGRAATGSAAGSRFGERSFGHLGFTGTSLWCDPDEGIVAVILTNRVNPSRDNVAIRAVRPVLGDALYDAAIALREGSEPSLLPTLPGRGAPSLEGARKTQKS